VDNTFRDQEIIDLTNLLFTELLGRPALVRISSLIKYANGKDPSTGDDNLAAIRARNHAARPGVPDLVKTVFLEYSIYLDLTTKVNASVRTVQSNSRLIAWHQRYHEMIEAVRNKDRAVMKELARWNIKSRRGVGSATLVLDYFVKTMDYETTQISNKLQIAQSIYRLVKKHGWGILILLPERAGRM
jgi:hypothetical protein